MMTSVPYNLLVQEKRVCAGADDGCLRFQITPEEGRAYITKTFTLPLNAHSFYMS